MENDWISVNYVVHWGNKKAPEKIHLKTIAEQLLGLIENEAHCRLNFSYQLERFFDFDENYSIVLFPVDSFSKKTKIDPIKFSEEKDVLIKINNFIREALGFKKIDYN